MTEQENPRPNEGGGSPEAVSPQIPVPTFAIQLQLILDHLVSPPNPLGGALTQGSEPIGSEWSALWQGLVGRDMESWFSTDLEPAWPSGLRLMCHDRRRGLQPGFPPPQVMSWRGKGKDSVSGANAWSNLASITDTDIFLVTHVMCRAFNPNAAFASPIANEFGMCLRSLYTATKSVHWYRKKPKTHTSPFVAVAGASPFTPEPGDYVQFAKAAPGSMVASQWQMRAVTLV